MKKYKGTLIVGILFLIAGVILLIVAFSNGVSRSSNYTGHTFVASDEIKTYNLDLSAGEFVTEFYDGDKATVEYSDSEKYVVTVTENNGTLTVKARFKWYAFFSWWNKAPKTTIKIPKNTVPDIKFHMSAGSSSLEGGDYGKVTVDISAGSFTAGNLNCTNLDCDISAGSIKIDGAVCNSIFCDIRAGSVKIDGAVCNSIFCDISAGSVKIDKIDCTKTEIDVSAGSATLNYCDSKENYSIKVSKSAGSCNVGNQTSTTGKTIYVDISAGSVSCNFVNAG